MRQNRPGKKGYYRIYLAHAWNTTALADGDYQLEVAAADTRGNQVTAVFPFTLRNYVAAVIRNSENVPSE